MSDSAEIEATFEAMAEAAIKQRGPAPLKAKGKGRLRPIVATKNGEPVKLVTQAELLEGLLQREGVEAAVEGKRPRVARCIDCSKPFLLPRRGKLSSRCSRCRRRAWAAANPGKLRADHRAWRAANAEKMREVYRARYAGNREKACAAQSARRAANPEKDRERSRVWRAKKKAEREAAKAATS